MADHDGASRRPGGRTARNRDAVQQACLRLLATRGPLGFGMAELADEAGVHRTTLYRRWQTMGELLGDVAAELINRDVPVPDTRSLEGDLSAVAHAVASMLSHPLHGPAMTALFTAPSAVVEVDAVVASFWTARLESLEPVVARAVARGEIPPETEVGLLFECLGAPLYYRLLVTRQPVDDEAVARAVRIACDAAANGSLSRTAR